MTSKKQFDGETNCLPHHWSTNAEKKCIHMSVKIIVGEAREALQAMPTQSVHMAITSPPYWNLRSYKGGDGMIGLEPTFDEHLVNLVAVFREVRRVLRDDGIFVMNYGDAYGAKNLLMMPARVAIALQEDGWYLRSEVIWHKPNPMPESATDRPTSAHEKIYLLSKSPKYFYDADAVRAPLASPLHAPGNKKLDESRNDGARMDKIWGSELGANMRNVLTVATHSFKGAHFATFPPKLIEPFVLAGTSEKGCCPECGAPWRRLATGTLVSLHGQNRAEDYGGRDEYDGSKRRATSGLRPAKFAHKTTGWKPSCECDAGEPMPCTILDCFGGAGTTGLVADRHKRDAVLVEISEEYAEIARKRIIDDAGMLADVRVEKMGETTCRLQS